MCHDVSRGRLLHPSITKIDSDPFRIVTTNTFCSESTAACTSRTPIFTRRAETPHQYYSGWAIMATYSSPSSGFTLYDDEVFQQERESTAIRVDDRQPWVPATASLGHCSCFDFDSNLRCFVLQAVRGPIATIFNHVHDESCCVSMYYQVHQCGYYWYLW